MIEDLGFKHVQAFLALAAQLHFGRAAAQLGIGQSLLSKRIAQAEAALGVRLFYRNRRNVKLTEAGALLLPEAQGLHARAAHLVDLAGQTARGEAGVLRVGYERNAMLGPLPTLIRRYRGAYRGVVLQFEELPSNEQLPRLANRELDVGFLYLPTYDETLNVHPLTDEPLMVALPLDHRLAAEPSIRLEALSGETWLAYPRALGPTFASRIDMLCAAAGLTITPHIEVTSVHTRLGLVAAGEGICLTLASSKEVEPPGVVILPLAPTIRFDLAAVWRQHHPSTALRTFVGVVRAAPVMRPGR